LARLAEISVILMNMLIEQKIENLIFRFTLRFTISLYIQDIQDIPE